MPDYDPRKDPGPDRPEDYVAPPAPKKVQDSPKSDTIKETSDKDSEESS